MKVVPGLSVGTSRVGKRFSGSITAEGDESLQMGAWHCRQRHYASGRRLHGASKLGFTARLGWCAARPGQEVPQMLVITRVTGEEVVIGNPASPMGVIRISSVKGDRVRLAFEFPKEIQVNRREVAEEKAREAEGNQSSVLGKITPIGDAG